MSFSIMRVLLLMNIALLSSAAVIPRFPGTGVKGDACTTDSDCALGCCGFKTGLCAGPLDAIAANAPEQGCGFGDAVANDNSAAAFHDFSATAAFEKAHPEVTVNTPDPTAPRNNNTDGPCTTDTDCALSCCGFKTGVCTDPLAALAGDGCGFGHQFLNNAAGLSISPQPAIIVNPTGNQLGPCASDSECAEGCCGFNVGLCVSTNSTADVVNSVGGCGFGNAEGRNPFSWVVCCARADRS
ncbi:hypothetical protein DFH06DRAFT_1338602 [Mycena polygramma]|nr:hypothetical protein DFH06DRAFT_1338602 [Mycena polygramma]